MSLLIYSSKTSPRLEYILEFIFNEVLLCEFRLTTNFEEFRNSTSPRLNYSKKLLENVLQITPHSLLFEEEITQQKINCFDWNEQKAFIQTSKNEVPFDMFAASFYLISRYEEYTTDDKDEFQRFPHTASIAFRNNFLNIPLVDIWLLELKKILKDRNSALDFKERKFTFRPTYDIDIAFSYRHKGFWRGLGGGIKDLFKGKIGAVFHRAFSVMRLAKDPYDTFDFLDKVHDEQNLSPVYFFLVGTPGELDKNISIQSTAMEKLIKRIAKKYEIGLHPSYQSNEEVQLVREERKNLRLVAEKKIKKSRQHYIKFKLPETYENLARQGFEEEYSMGYGSTNGFRASTSNPFKWYNLAKEEKTNLTILPFCFMECNSKFEQNQTLEKTKEELNHYIDVIKRTNGTFVSIWHNFSLGNERQWKGWRKLYEYQVEKSKVEGKGFLKKIKNIFS